MKSTEELARRLESIKAALTQRELQQTEIEEIELQLDKLTDLVSAKQEQTRSLLELKGLGKEIWLSTDVDEYLREERRSWR